MSFYGIVIPGIAPLAAVVAGVAAASLGIDTTLAVSALAWLVILGVAAVASSGLRVVGRDRVSTGPH